MFRNCSAYTISSETEWDTRLSGLLKEIGFQQNIRLNAAESLDDTRPDTLHFLFMHSSKSKDLIYKVTEAVRSSRDDLVRFMPIIVFVDESLESEVQEFITLGCDDIIIYPSSVKYITQRLSQQIRTRRDYFETPTFFGPDRRRQGMNQDHPDRRDGKESTFRHYVIKRSVNGAIKIVSNKLHTPQQQKKAG